MDGKNTIRKTIAGILVPFIQLYALYVIVHGDSGPGGGFQGGVILGASIILYGLAFGLEDARKRIAHKTGDILNSTGVFIYSAVGLLCMLAGGMYLEYDVLPIGEPHFASHIGIFAIEVGVGITVAAVMITVFFETADRRDRGGDGGD